MAAIYGAGAVIGFTPQEIDRMSLWQWSAAINGYVAAHSGKAGNLSDAEKAELADWIVSGGSGPRELKTERWWWDDNGPVRRGVVSFEVD